MPKFDINDIRKLLGLGSQTAPALIDDVVEEAGPLAKRVSTEATEVAPEVIGKGPRYADDAGEAIDAQFTDVNKMDEATKRMNPKLAKIAASLGLISGGAMMMGGGDEQPPTAQPPAAKAAPAPEGMEARIASDIKSDMMAKASGGGGVAAPSEGVETEPDLAPAEQRRSFEQELIDAQRSSGENTMWANLARSAQQVGGGIASLGAGSQVKNDYSGIDSLIASAGQPTKDVQARHGARKEQQAFDKAQDDLKDEAKMRDPSSEVSKLTTELAAKAGLIKPGTKMSAMALKNSGVNLGTLLSTIEAGKSRAEAARLARETRSEDTKLKLDAKSNEEALKREDKRKLTTEEIEDRRRNIMDNINLVKQAVKEKGTTELMGPHNENVQRMIDAIAVDMAKLADPNSVARPSEVEMFKKGLFSTGSEGMKLSNASALDIMDKFTAEVDRRSANAYKVRNISPNNSPTPAPGSTPESVQPRDNNSVKPGRQLVSKQYSKSRDKTRFIYSDGTEEFKDGNQ